MLYWPNTQTPKSEDNDFNWRKREGVLVQMFRTSQTKANAGMKGAIVQQQNRRRPDGSAQEV